MRRFWPAGIEGRADKALLLLGPTGTGKTALSIEAAQRLGGEVISVDSCAVYQGMDIGSAKPTLAERAAVPHHLIDIRKPDQQYNAGDFFRDACKLVKEIQARGRIPLIAGGTMMYASTLFNGINHIPTIEPSATQKVRSMIAERGPASVHEILAASDPLSAAKIKPGDRQRLLRAMEVLEGTGKPLSAWIARKPMLPDFSYVRRFVVPANRDRHKKELETRFHEMMEQGFLAEVASLLQEYGPGIDALKSVGYRQLAMHLNENVPLDVCVAKGVRSTKLLAKRQLTWIRKFAPAADEILEI